MTAPFTRWTWLGRVMLDREIEYSDKILAYWHAEHANARTLLTYPALGTLAKLVGMSTRGVQFCRERLVERKWLVPEQTAVGRKGGAVYRLNIPEGRGIHPDHVEIKAAKRMYVTDKTTNDTSSFDIENDEAEFVVSAGNDEGQRNKPRRLAQETTKAGAINDEAGFTLTSIEPPNEPQREHTRAHARDHLSLEFDRWYAGYPRKVAKPRARKAFIAARKKVDLETLIAGRERYKATKEPWREWQHPATWLNGECWADDPPAPTNGHSRNGAGRGHLREGSPAEAVKVYARENGRRAAAGLPPLRGQAEHDAALLADGIDPEAYRRKTR